MHKFLFTPRWLLLHLTIIATVVLTLNLASWQLTRHQQRVEFNKTSTVAIKADPVELASLVNELSSNVRKFEWRTVTIAGNYLNDETIVAVNRSQNGYSGMDPLTPIVVSGNAIQKTILVNRGFIALTDQVPQSPIGEVKITGRIRVSQTHRTGQLSDPSDGILKEVINIDLQRLGQQIDNLETGYFIELLESSPPDSPKLALIAAPTLSAGPHLGYVAQWIMIGLFVIAGWVIVIRRKIKKTTTR